REQRMYLAGRNAAYRKPRLFIKQLSLSPGQNRFGRWRVDRSTVDRVPRGNLQISFDFNGKFCSQSSFGSLGYLFGQSSDIREATQNDRLKNIKDLNKSKYETEASHRS